MVWPHYHYHHAWHRQGGWHHRPSRLLWFIIGASTATVYHYHKIAHEKGDIRSWDACKKVPGRERKPMEDVDAQIPYPHHMQQQQQHHTEGFGQSFGGFPPQRGFGWESFDQQRLQWEQERERLMAKATEMSESTLDSLAGTIESLRQKVAEHKVEKEKAQKALEEQKRSPPRLV